MRKGLVALMLVGSMAFNSQIIYGQGYGDFLKNIVTETDQFRYIPKGKSYTRLIIHLKGIEGRFSLYWYDKNKNNVVEDDEVFVDVNNDRIPDMLFVDFLKLYHQEKAKKELIRTSG